MAPLIARAGPGWHCLKGHFVLLRSRLLDERCRDRARGLPYLPVGLVVAGDALEQLDRAAVGRPVAETGDREPAAGRVRIAHRELVERGPVCVDITRVVGRERGERDQGRAARRRALVLEPTADELELLPEAELADRPERLAADAVVDAPRRRLELVVPLCAEGRELLLVARLAGERVGVRGCLRELHQTAENDRAAGPTYRADGRTSRLRRFCSRMCADHPAVREHANIAGASCGGTSATSRTTADQNSTFVASTRSGLRAWSSSATSKRGEPGSCAVPRRSRARGSSAR